MTQPLSKSGAEAARLRFVRRAGHDPARLEPLPGDASARRYFRLGGTGLMLLEDPGNPASYAAFVRIAAHLSAMGLRAPAIAATDPEAGLALIEDFGDGTYTNRLASGDDETALYALAVDALAKLHRDRRAVDVEAPDFDLDRLVGELDLFLDWFIPELRPDLDIAPLRDPYRALWRAALAPCQGGPRSLVLRDFHVDNLMLLADGACGLLDFQDAVVGPREYDLVSLLQDARRDLAPGLEARMRARYAAACPPDDPAASRRRYHRLGAQRHARIAGVFIRLWRRDSKPGYLTFLPRVLGQLDRALIDGGLGEIGRFLDDHLGDWRKPPDSTRQP